MNSLVPERVISLKADEFQQLQEQRLLNWEMKLKWKARNGREGTRLPPESDAILLAIEESQQFFFDEHEPTENLNSFLNLSCLVNYDITTHQMQVISKNTLRNEILSRKMHDNNTATRNFLPVQGKQDESQNWFTDSAVKAYKADGNFLGMLAICSCEIAGCKSTFAWIKGNVALLLVHIGSGGIRKIEIGPFALTKP